MWIFLFTAISALETYSAIFKYNISSYLVKTILGNSPIGYAMRKYPITDFERHWQNDCAAAVSLNLACHSCWKCISFSSYPWMTDIMGTTSYIVSHWTLLNKCLIHRFCIQNAVTTPMRPFGCILAVPAWGATRLLNINVIHRNGSFGAVSVCYVNVNLGIL